MKKILLQGTLLTVLFFGTWFLFAQINWMTIFKVQKATENTEQKLGKLFWDVFKKTEKENTNKHLKCNIDSMVSYICEANGINRTKVKVQIVEKDEINAFALPNGYLIIYTGLISNSASQEELAGVISHELAHIELNHVMKKLIQEIGFSVISSMTSGSGGATIIKEATKLLSSSAYERKLEKDADIKAVDYLVKANINPHPFANFLFKMSEKEKDKTKQLTWISTHPDSRERADYIVAYSKNIINNYRPVLSTESWKKIQSEIKKDQ